MKQNQMKFHFKKPAIRRKNLVQFLTLLIFPFILSCSLGGKAVKSTVKFSITYSFTGISAGYDHENKILVYVDSVLAGESGASRQSIPNSVTLQVTGGKHHLRIVNMALNGQNWEEHTIKNGYSIDCIFEKEIIFSSGTNLTLVFDLGKGAIQK